MYRKIHSKWGKFEKKIILELVKKKKDKWKWNIIPAPDKNKSSATIEWSALI